MLGSITNSEQEAPLVSDAKPNAVKGFNIWVLGIMGKVSLAVYKSLKLIFLNEKPFTVFVLTFVLNVLPVAIWMTTFKNARLIPKDIRPSIHVYILPKFEHQFFDTFSGFIALTLTLYIYCLLLIFTVKSFSHRFRKYSSINANIFPKTITKTQWLMIPAIVALSPSILNIAQIYAEDLNQVKDLFAFVSYGVIHFLSPFLTAFFLWFFAPPGILGVYGRAFGFQNLIGVMIHLTFPTAAPWYYTDEYGYGWPPRPGNYTLPGSAAGLKRVDTILHTHIYQHAFENSPLVFGALPSLHSAFAVINCLFISRYTSWLGKLITSSFICWQWWSTIYLKHHWRIDLLAGLVISIFVYTIALPSMCVYDYKHCFYSRTTGWKRIMSELFRKKDIEEESQDGI